VGYGLNWRRKSANHVAEGQRGDCRLNSAVESSWVPTLQCTMYVAAARDDLTFYREATAACVKACPASLVAMCLVCVKVQLGTGCQEQRNGTDSAGFTELEHSPDRMSA